jgi:hypothetical protein
MQRFEPRQISENAQTDPDTRAILAGGGVAVAGSMRAANETPAATRQLETRMTASKTMSCTLYISEEEATVAGPKTPAMTLIRERLARQHEDLTGTNGRSLLEGTKPVLVFVTLSDGQNTLKGVTLATYTLAIDVKQLETCALAIASNNFLHGCHDRLPWAAATIQDWPSGHPATAGIKRLLVPDYNAMSPYTAQSRHQCSEVQEQVEDALRQLPAGIKSGPVVCHADMVGGALGASIACLDLRLLAFVMLECNMLGTTGQQSPFATVLPIRTLIVPTKPAAPTSHSTEGNEDSTVSTWVTIAKKGNEKPHNPLGDSHMFPQHMWAYLPPPVLMQLDPGRPGPGNLIMFPHRVSNVEVDELMGHLLDMLVSEFTDKRPKSKEIWKSAEYWHDRLRLLRSYTPGGRDEVMTVGFVVQVDAGDQHAGVVDTFYNKTLPWDPEQPLWTVYPRCPCTPCALDEDLCFDCSARGHIMGAAECPEQKRRNRRLANIGKARQDQRDLELAAGLENIAKRKRDIEESAAQAAKAQRGDETEHKTNEEDDSMDDDENSTEVA